MMTPRVRTAIKISALCLTWYLTSSFNNVIGKQLLNQFEYPMTLTFVQLVSISVYSIPLLRTVVNHSNNNHVVTIPDSLYWKIIVPLAVGKFLASVSSHVSIWKVTVSYAHTVKATMPLFTVVLTRLLFNERHSTQIYLSLVPIILGVCIATATELSFNTTGLLTALLATCGFSLQNIFSKRVLRQTNAHQFYLLALLARLSLLMFTPFWLLIDVRSMMYHSFENTNVESVICLLVLDGFLNFVQNIFAFTILNLVSPLTYAVANATKRIFIITLSILLLRNPVSMANALGITIALAGVFAYNRAKVVEKRGKTYLPVYNTGGKHNDVI
ncbi:unnamed protein product [Orchesella dallaii]|uniref:Sugar phosphate transporter domain-containing protein n=1 Tax=Orchesella dallaii TaxID=48710 RepID=A0ABP1QMR6_9HEXA